MDGRAHNVAAFLVLCFLLQCGCGVKRPLKGYWPDGARWRTASRDALRDPGTWVPAAGALVFGLTNLDDEVADWAMTERPLFGTADNADEASDNLQSATRLGMYATALAVPGGDDPWGRKIERLLLQQVTAGGIKGLVKLTKSATGRTRPDGSDDRSFPSGHAAAAFSFGTFGKRNLDDLRLGRGWTRGLKIGFRLGEAGTAWARIEADKHYPSDVMASAALGNFIASLMHDAFLKRDRSADVSVRVVGDGVLVRLTLTPRAGHRRLMR